MQRDNETIEDLDGNREDFTEHDLKALKAENSQAEERLSHYGAPLHTKCCAVEIFRDEIHVAPSSYKTLIKNIEAACHVIALRWEGMPGVEGPGIDDNDLF